MRYLKLSQLVEIIDGDRGNNYPKNDELFSDGYCLFLNTKNVTKSGFNFDECQFISESKDRLLRKGKIKYNDLVFTTRGTVGNVALYDTKVKYINIRINSGMVILRCNEYVLPSFMLFLLRSYNSQTQIRMRCTGSAQPQLPLSIMSDIKFPCPPLPIQRKIAGILSAYDDLIENNRRQIKLLEEAARRLYKEWFVDLRFPGHEQTEMVDGLPAGWERKKLGEMGKIVTGKTPSTIDKDNYGGDIPFVKIPDMHGRIYPFETETYITAKGANKSCLIPKNSIMVSCIATVGLVSISVKQCQTNQQINSLILHEEEYLYYVYFVLKDMQRLLDGVGSNGATMTNVNKSKFSNLEIVTPCKELAIMYYTMSKSFFEKIYRSENVIRLLQEARDRLLPKLMNGEIEVTPQSALEVPGG